ncbi:hypothetical protein IK146_02075 [Candidatus Saccharibacteria bacterium]|nr:hypothetical protein [Candidatus Saccharibacteria bacterium]
MYGQTGDQDKQKKKIIIAALVMGIIIIILIGVLINAITSKNRAKLANNDQGSTAIVREDEKNEPKKINEDKKEDDAKAEDMKLEPVSNESTDNKTVTPSSNVVEDKPTTSAGNNNLPSTGPAGALGLALIAGSATSYVFSKKRK